MQRVKHTIERRSRDVPRALPRLCDAILALAGLFLLLLLLVDADVAMDGARRGLTLSAQTVFPSLFPFLVFSGLLVSSGAGEALGRLLGAPVKALFGLCDSGAASVILGAVCGAPVGTTTALAAYRRGELDRAELSRIVLFSNNPSTGFLIAAVGGGMFESRRVGAALWCITQLSAAAVGIALRFCMKKAPSDLNKCRNGAKISFSIGCFTDSVRRALDTVLRITAFVVFFSCIGACLSHVLPALHVPSGACVLLQGAMEMTGGIGQAAALLPRADAFLFAAFFASFSGLSVALQVFACLEGEAHPVRPYFAAKTAQALIALLLAKLYLLHFPHALSSAESVLADTRPAETRFPLFFLVLLAIAVLLALLHTRRATRVRGG